MKIDLADRRWWGRLWGENRSLRLGGAQVSTIGGPAEGTYVRKTGTPKKTPKPAVFDYLLISIKEGKSLTFDESVYALFYLSPHLHATPRDTICLRHP